MQLALEPVGGAAEPGHELGQLVEGGERLALGLVPDRLRRLLGGGEQRLDLSCDGIGKGRVAVAMSAQTAQISPFLKRQRMYHCRARHE